MRKLENTHPPLYPYEDWTITETKYSLENSGRSETVFALGNGYLGTRGTFEEGIPVAGTGWEGTYLNGFYESEKIRYAETAHGYPEYSQTMLNVANAKIVKVFVDNVEFNMLSGSIKEYRRTLYLKEGFLERSLVWISPGGKKVRIRIRRLVSFADRHLAAICYEVTPLNFDGEIRLVSALDGEVQNRQSTRDPRAGRGFSGKALSIEEKIVRGEFAALVQRTLNTKFLVVCAVKNQINRCHRLENMARNSLAGSVYHLPVRAGETVTLNKYIAYVTSQDYEETLLVSKAREVLHTAEQKGFERILDEQRAFLAGFWEKADLQIQGDPAVQQGIRFNLFHLLQSAGRDGKTSFPAKGLTGEGYEGHYFWDTEIYILPFFLYSNPQIGRKLLEFRYRTLEKARKRAREIGHEKGASYPWRTIAGEECSPYFPAGTAQYHINADIAYAVGRYLDATRDMDFLLRCGAEILFETARLWMELGQFTERKKNKFCIHGVTGPDEYTAIVNNNCYTNLLARENLEYAFAVAVWMRRHTPEEYENLARKINLEEKEIRLWKRAADNMYIPYDKRFKIYPQDDSFLEKPLWDLENTPQDKFPLLLHYHPLVLYRHQVCKQPDLLLALFLLSHKFTRSEKRRNFAYYERITAHDSSLSPGIFSILACEIGAYKKAYDYFLSTVRIDLDDLHGNTTDGIHAAGMAGAWSAVVFGFAGMRVYDDTLRFAPFLPRQWEGYSFRLAYRDRVIKITVNRYAVTYELLEGDDLSIFHYKKKKRLKKGAAVACPYVKTGSGKK